MRCVILSFLLLSSISSFTQCYKILGVVPAPPYSHFTLGFRLMKALADKGHEITFINSHPQQNPIKNLRDVSTEDIKKPYSGQNDEPQLDYMLKKFWSNDSNPVGMKVTPEEPLVENNFSKTPHNLDDLKRRITLAIRSVTPEMFSNVTRYLYTRLACCQDLRDYISGIFNLGQLSYLRQLEWVANMGKFKSKLILQNKNVQNLIHSNETFDLVITNHLFSDALAYFAYRFKCPLVILAPGSTNLFSNYLLANPSPPSYVTNLLADHDTNMNFWQRLINTYREIAGEIFIHNMMIPAQNAALKEVIPDAPELTSIIFNASLILAASHSSLYDPVPLQPNIKEIGGHHVLPPKPLPAELQEFMDNSPEGVIIFSMGSHLKSAKFEPEKRKAILNAFSKIKQKILWKFEADLPEKPENVKILKWLPQADILAHPNVVAFISHGGLLGTMEAIYHGVPILGLPVFWDQSKNIKVAVSKGFAVKVEYHDIDEKSFEEALNEILNNDAYRKKAKERSAIMRDQPIKQLDEAVFWCEYVIRHQGAPHLRSASLNLRWYQLYYLDIILFVCLIFTAVYTILKCTLRLLFRKLFRYENKQKKNK